MSTKLTDSQLVKKAQDGDKGAFEILYNRWKGKIISYLHWVIIANYTQYMKQG